MLEYRCFRSTKCEANRDINFVRGFMLGDSSSLWGRVFGDLEPKDWITLCSALAAFVISALSYFSKSKENRLSLRKQLTDVLEKITELNLEAVRSRGSGENEGYPEEYRRLLNDQRRFLVRQAAHLIGEISYLVSPYEYGLTANAFQAIDEVDQAEKFFNLAVKRAKSRLDRGIILRQYVRFLYSQGRVEEARTQMPVVLDCFTGESDLSHYYRADTYERWSRHEQDWSDLVLAKNHLEEALREYKQIKMPSRRDTETRRVQGILTTLDNPPRSNQSAVAATQS